MSQNMEPCVNCGESYPDCDHHGDGICVDCRYGITTEEYKKILIKRVEDALMTAEDAFDSYEEAVAREAY